MTLLKSNPTKDCQKRIIQPLVNIQEEQDCIILEAEMPGLEKSDICVELKDKELVIKGTSSIKAEGDIPKGYTLVHRERCPWEYERAFLLGENIDKNKIEATYDSGVLKIRLPRSKDGEVKKIEIKE